MARYFFDIHDGTSQFDEEGTECASLDEVRVHALKVLPEIARDEAPSGNDRSTYSVLVSDEDHHPVYSATLYSLGSG